MHKVPVILVALLFLASFYGGPALAAPDQYMGDTAIYSGASTSLRPNVLLIIDNSNATTDPASGEAYNPSTVYANNGYASWNIYEADQQGDFSKTAVINTSNTLENLNCSNNNNIVKNTLLAQGTYVGSGTTNNPNIKNNVCDTSPTGKTYALGNFLNYTQTPAVAGSDSQRKVIYDALETVVGGARYAVNFGAMVYGSNNKGGNVIYQVGDLTNDSDYESFLDILPGGEHGTPVLSSETARPQAEALLDAGYYFRGQGLPVSGQAAMTSPIQDWCNKSYIILITNGLSNKDDDPQLATLVGDFDTDRMESSPYGLGTHYLDDVAKKLYESDNSSTLNGFQRIVTNTILAFQANDSLVQRAADDSHGRGGYFNVANAQELAEALTKLINNIVLEADTSFVAPVVPVSPENRTYSGSRVYMGFFKPITQSYWQGNLKKYGINSNNNITDENSLVANYVDLDGNGYDDNTGLALPSWAINGTFKATATSFWSSAADGGAVDSGGAGNVLLTRDFSTSPRNIFTYTGTNTNLTNASNAFSKTNAAITTGILGVSDDTAKNKLVDFVYGIDTYDENGNGNTTEKRSWILGDVLHSKPLIVNYAAYTFSSSNESDCSVNKSMIFVGANDGMLHAFKDCDGSEAWAFIPPDLLANLKHIPGLTHTYFADSSPNVYVYDADNDGDIETANGDKVIVIFGQRRGGGTNASPTRGSYYTLDVSAPAVPVFLWSIDRTAKTKDTTITAMTDYSELAETWSEPKLVKMKIGGSDKIVAFVGAGYDNAYEDSRYGATQTFSGTGTVNFADLGTGAITSSGTSTSSSQGRGVYAIEIADLNSGAPVFTNSGNKIRGFTHAEYANMAFSFPGEITALDMDNNGYTDRLYASDAGGNIWRFNVADTNPSSWAATKIFSANPGSGGASDTGRKIFYKPSAVVEPGNLAILYFGTGDREHPLNWNVVDRLYALKDRGQSTAMVESNLVDVTLDLLQTTTVASGAGSISDLLTNLNAADKYGWYIKLDENSGEKVLAPPTVFNKVAYFTTYAPNTTVAPDPCQTGNLGTARLYAVDYLTGEAVLDYDTANDSTTINNKRANYVPGQVLVRSDRSVTLGSGIPSGIVLIINPNGGLKALIGVGGVIPGQNPKKGGSIIPLYWRQK
ncbi:MAG: pilus assembly protein [Geobacteraceae bacterium]